MDFEKSLSNNKEDRKILLTIDDGLLSFYNNAWPILKKKKISEYKGSSEYKKLIQALPDIELIDIEKNDD